MNLSPTLSGLVADVLQLSEVTEDERVVLVTTTAYDPHILDSYLAAIESLGAEALRLILPRRVDEKGRLTQPLGSYAADVLKEADMVLRPITVHNTSVPDIFMYDEIFREILFAGTRWLDVVIHEEGMRRLFPDQALIERTMAGVALMEEAEQIRITSEAGTDLTLSKKGRSAHKQTGIVDEPGMWDNFGFGLVACAPLEDSAEGTLVLDAGDSAGQVAFGDRHRINPEPITLTFRQGRIVDVAGGHTALMLRRWLEQNAGDGGHRIAHAGWGTHDRAVWQGGWRLTHADWESYLGCIMIHFGVNIFDTPCRFSGLGGATYPPDVHWGGSLLNCNFYLDDELVVEKGTIVHADCR
jgi:2,5-dihydroxypyridine 5,6-dioxygenase